MHSPFCVQSRSSFFGVRFTLFFGLAEKKIIGSQTTKKGKSKLYGMITLCIQTLNEY